MVGNHKSNWHHMLFSTLLAYQISTNIATSFTPFHLVHDVELVLPIEFQIPSLCLVVELLPNTSPLEKNIIMLENINEDRHASLHMIKAATNR